MQDRKNWNARASSPARWALLAVIVALGACGQIPEPEPGCRVDCSHVEDQGTPNDGDGTPSNDDGTPSDDDGTPSDGDGTPSDDDGTPSDGDGTPSDDDGTPSDDDGTPSDGDGTPDDECPVDCEPPTEEPPPEEPPNDPVPEPGPPVEEPKLRHRQWTSTNADFLNPERGLYSFANLPSSSFSGERRKGISLVYGRVVLDAYRSSPIPSSYLADIESGFARARTAGVKVIPRFVYNKDGGGDASKERILEHIAQLKPILRANADVIATLQAGFIGRWGEWHGSTNGLDNARDRAEVLKALLDAMPKDRTVQVRTPHFKSEALGGPLAESRAFDGSDAARVGHHNDCYLSSNDDVGTYKAPVETWKDFVAEEGRFTPVGGETCKVFSPRTDCPSFKQESQRLHYSFLNNDYHPDVISRLASQGCLDEMVRRLGYRLALSKSALSEAVRPGGVLVVEAELRNEGYAAMFNARPVYVVLDGPGGRHEALLSELDPRRWESGKTARIDTSLRVPASLAPGSYRVSLWLPDAAASLRARPEYAVRFANDGVWEPDRGTNVLGTLRVDREAPGAVDPKASKFVELRD